MIELLSSKDCAVRFPFDKDIIEGIKEGAKGKAKFDKANKEWIVQREVTENLYDELVPRCLKLGFKIVEIPDFVIEMCKNTVPFQIQG